MKIKSFYILSIAIFCQIVHLDAQDQTLEISRQKALTLIRKVDSFIDLYERYSFFCQDTSNMDTEVTNYLSLFESPDAEVFDDINPNISAGREDRIVETVKTANEYINDIHTEFVSHNTKVTIASTSLILERLVMKDGKYYFPVSIVKDSWGFLKDTTKSKQVSTHAKLELWMRLKDTINCELKISSISKEGPLGVEWDYQFADLKRKNVETSFFIKPSYSSIFINNPHIWNTTILNNYIVLTDANPVIDNSAILANTTIDEKIGLPNNMIWGSYGVNGEIDMRFFWRKESKNKTKGFSMGIGGGFYNSFFQSDFYSEVFHETDIDGDGYYRISTVDDIIESWSFITVDIPIKYSMERWKTYKKGRYFKLGVRGSYMIANSTAKGELNHYGYYPQYGTILSGIEQYGFSTDERLKSRKELPIKPYNIGVELAFGKKRKAKSGKSVFYTGLNIGAYVENINMNSDQKSLFTFDYAGNTTTDYNSVLGMMNDFHVGYVGLVIGIRRADKNEFLLKKKEVKYSSSYADNFKAGYTTVKVPFVDRRDFSSEFSFSLEMIDKDDVPKYQRVNMKPVKFIDYHINNNLILSRAEKKRIRKENAKDVHISFIIDRFGLVRDVNIENQKNTEIGAAIFSIIHNTSGYWTPGKINDIPTNVLIKMTYTY